MLTLPPLGLYIHVPWCVQKCPYCDFNSHALKQGLPEREYVDALLRDLEADLSYVQGRSIDTIFIGGGTPSLLSTEAIARLLSGVAARVPLAPDAEITLEANPGTVEAGKFIGFRQAGVNRISIGVQSFQADKLARLGRIHDPAQAVRAAEMAADAGLNSYNLDLMHGLPDQGVEQALDDLKQALELAPPHLSWYQLTIEPNTQFFSRPPALPDDDVLWEIYQRGHQLLTDNGYQQYEISGYSRDRHQCRHNLNYWRFGDYLGIGCGAHGKITLPAQDRILRTVKVRHPKGYLEPGRAALDQVIDVPEKERPVEYFMNRFRLFERMPLDEFSERTGVSRATIMAELERASADGLLSLEDEHCQLTARGHRYLNSLLERFLQT